MFGGHYTAYAKCDSVVEESVEKSSDVIGSIAPNYDDHSLGYQRSDNSSVAATAGVPTAIANSHSNNERMRAIPSITTTAGSQLCETDSFNLFEFIHTQRYGHYAHNINNNKDNSEISNGNSNSNASTSADLNGLVNESATKTPSETPDSGEDDGVVNRNENEATVDQTENDGVNINNEIATVEEDSSGKLGNNEDNSGKKLVDDDSKNTIPTKFRAGKCWLKFDDEYVLEISRDRVDQTVVSGKSFIITNT